MGRVASADGRVEDSTKGQASVASLLRFMGLRETFGALHNSAVAMRQWRWLSARRPVRLGDTDVVDARRLADAERATSGAPDGCAWLDNRTVEELDLALVFRAVNRTATPTGAQALWRWLAAPAVRLDVLAAREAALARLAQPEARDRIRDALAGQMTTDAPHVPRLLWEAPPPPLHTGWFAVLAGALAVLAVLAAWWPPLVSGCVVLLVANILLDQFTSARQAHQGYALGVLCQQLAAAERVLERGVWPDAAIAADVAACAGFRKGVRLLTVSDPLGLADLLRAGFHVRPLVLGKYMREVVRERARFRRIVLWLGELDAGVSIATLRAERADARVPRLVTGAARINAGDLVHPAVANAIGNDLVLTGGLLVTGSNMSGKSTFLRTVAINAICAQSIHTTFGRWDASLFRVFTVMRIADATAEGMSTYAVEVAAIGALVAAVSSGEEGPPALFVVDEPFSGTNPALRVPIVVSVLEYCGARDLVLAATHDLDVVEQVDVRFARGYFAEADDDSGRFDRKLRAGVSPGSNALSLLVRAGYPSAIIDAVEHRVRCGAIVRAVDHPLGAGRRVALKPR